MGVPTVNQESPLGRQYLSYAQLPVKYSKVHLRLLEKEGKFPKRIFLSPRLVVWAADEIQEWLEQHQRARKG